MTDFSYLHLPMHSQYTYPNFHLYHRLVKAKMYIDAHYHQSIDLNGISGEAYFSKFHFIRTFKKIYGKTPYQYLISVRVEQAKLLLQQGMPVSTVCFEVGFESVSSFTGLFKKVCDVTPSVYQDRHIQLRQAQQSKPFHFIPGCYVAANGWKKNSNFKEAIQ